MTEPIFLYYFSSKGFSKLLAKEPQVPPEAGYASSGGSVALFLHFYSHLAYKFPLRMRVVAYNCEICDLYKEGYMAKEKHETGLKFSLCLIC